MQGAIAIHGLGRDYRDGKRTLTVLDGVDLAVQPGEFLAITGPSGSGKSTLLGLLAGLDRPDRGSVVIDGVAITALAEDELAVFRGRNIGFVFQSFQLVPTLTALENVRVPAELLGDSTLAARAEELLARVGLQDRMDHFPAQLSGGEMQRVAIARASINRPKLLLADEPTGNLDSVAGEQVLQLLREANEHCTLILVTHDADLAGRAGREVRLKDGRVVELIDRRSAAAMRGDASAAS
jgi:putative ABC transport system ATP-binding protein